MQNLTPPTVETAPAETAGLHPVLVDILLEEEPDTLCWVKA